MKKTYTLDSGMDIRVVLTLDTELLSKDVAMQTVSFWSNWKDFLKDDCGGDVYLAFAKHVASQFVSRVLDGYLESRVASLFREDPPEGFPIIEGEWVTLEECEVPDWDIYSFRNVE